MGMSRDTNEETTLQLVVAKVADTLCGIEIDAVHEIILMQEITVVPQAPRNMLGMIDIRGMVLPVVALRACLGFPSTENTHDTRIVLVSYRDKKVGLVVDGVAEVTALPKEAFQSLKGKAGESPYLRSVALLEDRLILDIDHVRVLEEGIDTDASGMSLLDVLEGELTEEAESDDDAATGAGSEDEAGDGEDAAGDEARAEARAAAATPEAPDDEDNGGGGGLKVELLESSLELIAAQGDQLVERFYEGLFETAPAFRSLFASDLEGQKQELLCALDTIINSLREPKKLTTYRESLAKQDGDDGGEPAQYDVVAEVLLATMAELAGDAWSDELQSAWAEALTTVKDLMLAGADTIQAAAA